MKILLIGEYYSQNLGDPVLCKTVEYSILKSIPDAEIVPFDMSGRIDFDSCFEPKEYTRTQKWFFRIENRLPFLLQPFALCRVIQKDEVRYMRTVCLLDKVLAQNSFDLAVFAGGSIFMDYFAGVIYGIVGRCAKRNIPVIFHACGMSYLTQDTRRVLQKALNFSNVRSVSLRDGYQRFMEEFHIRTSVEETFDTALGCSQYFPGNPDIVADIGIGVIWIPAHYEFQKALVRSVQRTGKNWKIFTNGAIGDWETAKRILNDLGIPECEWGDYLADRPGNAEECIQTVTGFRKIVSFRMHSQIIATSYGIPSVGFVWDEKVRNFYTKLGREQNCLDVDASINWEEIERRLCSGGEKLINVATSAGCHSTELLEKKIRSVCEEVRL